MNRPLKTPPLLHIEEEGRILGYLSNPQVEQEYYLRSETGSCLIATTRYELHARLGAEGALKEPGNWEDKRFAFTDKHSRSLSAQAFCAVDISETLPASQVVLRGAYPAGRKQRSSTLVMLIVGLVIVGLLILALAVLVSNL